MPCDGSSKTSEYCHVSRSVHKAPEFRNRTLVLLGRDFVVNFAKEWIVKLGIKKAICS